MVGFGKRVVVLVLAASASLFALGTASAQSSRFSYVSKPGDPIGQGTRQVIENRLDAWRLTGTAGDGVFIAAYGDNRTFYLALRTPTGAKLVPKVYSGAVAFEGNKLKPGLSFSTQDRQCASSTGAFEVLDAKLGPLNYIERLHVRFKQTCTGASAGAYGEVMISNPPPPPVVTSRVVWDRQATLSRGGWITLRGTYTCSKDNTDIGIFTRARQVTSTGKTLVGEMEAREDYELSCDPTPRRIERVIYPTNCTRFIAGPARITYDTYLRDPDFNSSYTTRRTVDVTVVRGY